jgi:hypothetical protein
MGASTPPKLDPLNDPDAWEDGGDRPTVVPDFDPEAFARDSEIRQRAGAVDGGEPTIDQARRLHQEGQDENALFLLTRLLELAPLHPEATALLTECRGALERQCLSAIGTESAMLVPSVSAEELKTFALDHVSGFLFSLIDGATSVENLLDISGLPRLLALRHLRNLIDRGLVAHASGHNVPVALEPVSSRSPEVVVVADDAAGEIESSTMPVHVPTATLDAMPVLLVAPEDIEGLDLDPRARAIVDLVNDGTSVQQILSAAGIDEAKGLALFERLAAEGVLTFV